MKIGIIGDAHFRESLAYADYISDRREGERKQILDFIVESFKDCDSIVFMGDNFDKPNPPSKVIKAFTEFVERFNGKQVFILAGNHEKTPDGRTAVDYLKEVKNPNWHIITDNIELFENMAFVPYLYRQELKVDTHSQGSSWIMEGLEAFPKNIKFIFVHHAISDSLTVSGQSTNLFNEIVLPRAKLEEMFTRIVGGHIHKPQLSGKTLVTGSVFSNEAGDVEQFVWTLDTETSEIGKFQLPIRPIYRLENPEVDKLLKLSSSSIVKVILTDPKLPVDKIKEVIKRFDVYLLLEQYPNERKKLHMDADGAMIEFSVENLLGMYAKSKNIDEAKLLAGWNIIK
jgi:hypothetical protein